ncbi:hypothetical protein MMC15_003964 [Xylographa vitiligo]|nr:hypothetical protein [Xylographa vitiligo]
MNSPEPPPPDRVQVLFYTKARGPRIRFPPPEKTQAEIDEEEYQKTLLIEANMVDLGEDETMDDYDPNAYDSDDTDAGAGPQRSDWNRPDATENKDEPRLQTQHYHLSDIGKEFAFRGKGPESGTNTASLDCTLVIALQLGVGGSLDRGRYTNKTAFIKSLSPFHETFYREMTENTWDTNSAEVNRRTRDMIFDDLVEENAGVQRGEGIPFPTTWNLCTSFSPQLRFTTVKSKRCVHCAANVTDPTSPGKRERFRTDVTLAKSGNADERTTMQEMLQRLFGPRPPKGIHDCSQGPNATPNATATPDAIEERPMVLGELPTTLAVIPDASYRNIEGATADSIRLNYLSTSGERRATYRWLGGAYQNHGSHRVYWADDDFPNPRGQLRVYDPQQANGIIVGDLPPDHYENKIVDYWADGCAMLFYQRMSVESTAPTPLGVGAVGHGDAREDAVA